MNDSSSILARDAAYAGLKVVGVMLLLRTLKAIVGLVNARRYASPEDGIESYLFWSGLYVIAEGAMALACLFNTGWLARVLVPVPTTSVPLSGDSLAQVAIQVAGCVLVVVNGAGLLTNVLEVLWLMGEDRSSVRVETMARDWTEYVYYAAATGGGLFLLLRARWIASLGVKSSEERSEET